MVIAEEEATLSHLAAIFDEYSKETRCDPVEWQLDVTDGHAFVTAFEQFFEIHPGKSGTHTGCDDWSQSKRLLEESSCNFLATGRWFRDITDLSQRDSEEEEDESKPLGPAEFTFQYNSKEYRRCEYLQLIRYLVTGETKWQGKRYYSS